MNRKYHTLSQEILGYIGFSAIISAFIFWLLRMITTSIVEEHIFNQNITIDEFEWINIDHKIFIFAMILSCIIFSLLFLSLLSKKIRYINQINASIHDFSKTIPLIGNDELTQLASTINEVSFKQNQLREKEKELSIEKENLIHSLAHDIRTPLTSILSYSDYMINHDIDLNEQKDYLNLIHKKAKQIHELTDILLDGNKRNLEYFENGLFLFKQLLSEFEEELEDYFDLHIDLSHCDLFSGTFDIQELRRIFDNLSSNIQKYADSNEPIILHLSTNNNNLIIEQSNKIKQDLNQQDSYHIGINSIKRIVQMYHGKVEINQTETSYTIHIHLHL